MCVSVYMYLNIPMQPIASFFFFILFEFLIFFSPTLSYSILFHSSQTTTLSKILREREREIAIYIHFSYYFFQKIFEPLKMKKKTQFAYLIIFSSFFCDFFFFYSGCKKNIHDTIQRIYFAMVFMDVYMYLSRCVHDNMVPITTNYRLRGRATLALLKNRSTLLYTTVIITVISHTRFHLVYILHYNVPYFIFYINRYPCNHLWL